ncbi:MAG: polysaccharide ABC transporter ATP-binding protein [Luteolibacter sp.]
MSVVISVENVSKLYRLGEIGTGSLAHDVNRWWHKVRGKEDPYLKIGQVNDRAKKAEKLKTEKLKGENEESPKVISAFQRFGVSASSPSDYVYALKDISFEVKQGEVLGIIGRNGAGKSTLLKILSRVTSPTTGEIKAKGRIASLLEVGTGFHPELSGRDNIFLNGAILGMRKAEIQAKFDEIVDFSGCERYIDTPVKRYSSGMYVRLAFAVAAHLESEILIVDEVLAVGDAEFQKQCLGKMRDVAGHGRTVLFVSHNMNAVSTLCSTALLVSNGKIAAQGGTRSIIDRYVSQSIPGAQDAKGSRDNLTCSIVQTKSGEPAMTFSPEDAVAIEFRFTQLLPHSTNIGFTIYNTFGTGVISGIYDDTGEKIPPNTSCVRFPLPAELFNSGDYRVEGVLLDESGQSIERQEAFCFFSVQRSNQFDLRGDKPDGALRLDSRKFTIAQ